MTTRRNFLKVLGLGTASAPLAAKAALEDQTLRLMQTGTVIASGGPNLPGGVGAAPVCDEFTARVKMADYIRVFGKVPDHVMEQMRADSKWVYALDFDIANKRSWSLAAKVNEQRQRNLREKIARIEQQGAMARARQLFSKTFGYEFLTW